MGRRVACGRCTGERLLALLLWLVACLLCAGGCHRPARTPETWGDHHRFRRTADPVISSAAVYDFDGDGVSEIAIGSWDGYAYMLDSGLQDLPGWPQYSPKGFFSSPALADLDADGSPEVLLGAETGQLYAWHADGRSVAGFPVALGDRIWASPTVLPGPHIAIGTEGWMHVLDAKGQPVAGWPRPLQGWPDSTAAYAQGLVAVTTLTPGDPSQGWAYAWQTDGTPLPGFPVALSLDSDSSPAWADLDQDGRPWMIFGDDAGWLHVLDTDGRQRDGFPVRVQGPGPDRPTPTPAPPGGNPFSIEASPALADLTGDGHLEIVVGSWDGRLYIWNDAGELLPGWPIQVGDQIISSAALIDLDGDDRLDIVVGSKDGYLYGWQVGGQVLAGFPYHLRAPVFSSPWIGDLEDDGRADIVVGADNGIHLLTDVGPLGRQAWPTFHQNLQRQGSVP